MTDGRVFTGGGGLCGSAMYCGFGTQVNHLDAEVFSPPYLYQDNGQLAPRPSINVDKDSAGVLLKV